MSEKILGFLKESYKGHTGNKKENLGMHCTLDTTTYCFHAKFLGSDKDIAVTQDDALVLRR